MLSYRGDCNREVALDRLRAAISGQQIDYSKPWFVDVMTNGRGLIPISSVLGWPLWLGKFADEYTMRVRKLQAIAFATRLLSDIPIGVDLEPAAGQFLTMILEHPGGVRNYLQDEYGSRLLAETIALLSFDGQIDNNEPRWEALATHLKLGSDKHHRQVAMRKVNIEGFKQADREIKAAIEAEQRTGCTQLFLGRPLTEERILGLRSKISLELDLSIQAMRTAMAWSVMKAALEGCIWGVAHLLAISAGAGGEGDGNAEFQAAWVWSGDKLLEIIGGLEP